MPALDWRTFAKLQMMAYALYSQFPTSEKFTWVMTNALNFNMGFVMNKNNLCIVTKLALSQPPNAKCLTLIFKILVNALLNNAM